MTRRRAAAGSAVLGLALSACGTLEIGARVDGMGGAAGTAGGTGDAAGGAAGGATPAPVAGSVNGPSPRYVKEIAIGDYHACALISDGGVRCWGRDDWGELGRAFGLGPVFVGDDETPASGGDLDLGGRAIQIAVSDGTSCALLDTGTLRCWGSNNAGNLGYGHTFSIGDNETPAAAGDVDVGGRVVQVSVGTHTCAVLDTGRVRCWGVNEYGQLGYGNTRTIGDDETPASAGDIDLGGPAVRVAAGNTHTCAVLVGGKVRCWGQGEFGALGYGNRNDIGDDETPSSAGDVDVGGPVREIAVGPAYTCALLDTGRVRCWGLATPLRVIFSQGDSPPDPPRVFGDDESAALAPLIELGGVAVAISVGNSRLGAVLDTGGVRCWGLGEDYPLGYGRSQDIGDDETPASAGDVPIGGRARALDVASQHICALLENGSVRCWGKPDIRALLGMPEVTEISIGDNEFPERYGPLELL